MRRLSVLYLLLLLFLLSACMQKDGSDAVIRYDIPGGVHNLDPQFATDETARLIISSTMEGLFHMNPDGTVQPALAERYTVSSDQLTYTFYLRQDAVWRPNSSSSKENLPDTPVTAKDFTFALRRLFTPGAPSPFASSLASIRNAVAVSQGTLPPDELGIRALDDYTLEITLSRPDSLLLEQLAASFTSPCNEAFFLSTRARYGLELESLLFNGPFYLRGWDNGRVLSMRRNNSYYQADRIVPLGIDLYIPGEIITGKNADGHPLYQDPNPSIRFLEGVTDACKMDFSFLQAVESGGGTYVSFEDTVWVLALNLDHPQLANADIRKAIGYSVDRDRFTEYLPRNLFTATTLIPSAISLYGHAYRDYAGSQSPISYTPDLAKRSLRSGLQSLEDDRLRIPELLICDETPQGLLAGAVQWGLERNLSLSTGLVKLDRETLLNRVSAGDYEMAIIPLTASYSSPEAFLSKFRSNSAMNLSNYQNNQFDALLNQTSSTTGEEVLDLYRQAEQLLLADCPVIPLYFETTYYAMAEGVSDIGFAPFLSGMSFRNARKQ